MTITWFKTQGKNLNESKVAPEPNTALNVFNLKIKLKKAYEKWYRKPLRINACSRKRINLGLTACSKHVKMIIFYPLLKQHHNPNSWVNAALIPKIL